MGRESEPVRLFLAMVMVVESMGASMSQVVNKMRRIRCGEIQS